MIMSDKFKKCLPDALAVVFFIVIAFAYFINPVTEGLVLSGHDHTGGIGAGVEMNEYYQRTGERTRWTNSLFSGMPTYQLSPSYSSTDMLSKIEGVYELGLPDVVMYVYILLLGFYILLRAFNFKVWMAVLGAVIWAFSSYFFIIIGAGHIWKVLTLAFIPPTIAGLVLCYRGKYLWGAVVTAFFVALQILSNHVQMSYYFLPVMLFLSLAYLIDAYQKKKMMKWVRATGVLIGAGLLGVCMNISNLYHTYEYSKESMRGKSELTQKSSKDPANQTNSGLERDYITQWSYGIGETWTLLVPNAKGGASHPLTHNEVAMEKANSQYLPIYQALGQYWGEQPGTSGPVYVGAFVLMLFVLGLFIVSGPLKWGLLTATILSILLSWGKNFMGLTDFFLDYVPMYDKFRTVASILVVAEFTIPLLAMLALKKIVDDPQVLKKKLHFVYISFGLTGGFALLFALMPDVFFGEYISSSETSMLQQAVGAGYIPQDMFASILDNLSDMRRAVFVHDAWRSFAIIAVGVVLLLLYNIKKINNKVMIMSLIVICLVDMWQVNKRYMNDTMFVAPSNQVQSFAKTPVDEYILQDPNKSYRVLNLTASTFNENNTSYYHKSIGGYHAAKLRRYQEMIGEHIQPEMMALSRALSEYGGRMELINGDSIFPVLNMLNAKYLILPQQNGQAFPLQNPYVNGNGWFVKTVKYVKTADEEIQALHKVNPKDAVVVNEEFRAQLGDAAELQYKDSLSTVKLTAYDANALSYEVNSSKGGVVVFSEIYYPGWTATVDGKPVDIARANYILRAIKIEPGKHKVDFKFDPQSVKRTEAIAYAALVLLLLVVVGLVVYSFKNAAKKP